ncbi:MAG: transglycosylase domain-containing protein, partial [Patescibacteria group bacterium]
VEDERFYEEPAFDWKGIARALIVNIRHGQARQGASTITQQLARNAFLTAEQTISRKIKEIILATRINQYYTKDQILALYLNEIPYGATTYGVEAASEAFFDKHANELNLAQSAVIAALPKAPSYYSPWGSHVKELLSRQRVVLKKMFDLGKITEKEYDEALKFKILFSSQGKEIKAPHFVMNVQEYLVQKYGEDLVRKGGLRVITTLQWNLQQAAQKAVFDGAERNEKLYGGTNASLVAENPKTGEILALVGSRDYFDIANDGNFDVATQGLRQPGSALKPFVYLAAFEKGLTPDTVLFDVPTEFAANNPLCPPDPDFENENKECFHPQNYSGEFKGPVSIRMALAQSINIPAVKALYIAGVRDVVKKAANFGLTTLSSPDTYGLSLVLGGGAVRLINLVDAYSVLSQDGIKHKQAIILEVKDSSGNVLESYENESARITNPEPVRVINSVLSDTEARRGLFGAGGVALTTFTGHDVAIKTGTSNDYRDAWAIGYTPSIVVGVWAGNNDNSPMHRQGSSILAAVPIWNAFMTEAIKNIPQDTFIKPESVAPAKHILSGDYLNNKQIHTILYYVDKGNPLGPSPSYPEADPQFVNWEFGVLRWAQNNIPDFKDYNQIISLDETTETSTTISFLGMEIQKPTAGQFIINDIEIKVLITSRLPLSRIKAYWNGVVMDEILTQETNFELLKNYPRPLNTAPQNVLEIEAIDQNNYTRKTSVIVYGQ